MNIKDNKLIKELSYIIQGAKDNGADYVKIDDVNIYFTIKIGSFIDTEEYLRRFRDLLLEKFDLILKIKKI